MKYNDYVTLSSSEYQILQENYDKVRIQERDDLKEIINKLREQKMSLETSDKQEKYSVIIPKLQDSIANLERIVASTSSTLPKHNLPNPPSNFREVVNNTCIQEEVITPIKNTNITNKKRKYSTQNNFFTNILKKLNIIDTKVPNTKYHTIVIADNEITTTCYSHKQNCSRQLDIIRLLLLYMTLRPTCPYIHTLSSVATDQLDVYMSLLNE